MEPNCENSTGAAKGCGKAAPWKSPKNGLFHLAWKSAYPADFHFPHSLGCDWNERPFSNENGRNTHNSTLPDINLLSTKNGLDFGVHLRWPTFPLADLDAGL
jgi:hypothetical protein